MASVLSDVCVVRLLTLILIQLFKNELDLRKERFELCIEELPLISLELDQVLCSPEVRVIGVVDELVPAVFEIRKAVELIWEGPVGGVEDITALQLLLHLAPNHALRANDVPGLYLRGKVLQRRWRSLTAEFFGVGWWRASFLFLRINYILLGRRLRNKISCSLRLHTEALAR